MHYSHIKLNNGEDLIGTIVNVSEHDSERDALSIFKPILVKLDPRYGVMCKIWNSLTEGDVVTISRDRVMYYGPASKMAIGYYQEFFELIKERSSDSYHTYDDDSGEIGEAINELYQCGSKVH